MNLADAIRKEEAALTRRFLHHTRPSELSLADAMCLSERMAQTMEAPDENLHGRRSVLDR